MQAQLSDHVGQRSGVLSVVESPIAAGEGEGPSGERRFRRVFAKWAAAAFTEGHDDGGSEGGEDAEDGGDLTPTHGTSADEGNGLPMLNQGEGGGSEAEEGVKGPTSQVQVASGQGDTSGSDDSRPLGRRLRD